MPPRILDRILSNFVDEFSLGKRGHLTTGLWFFRECRKGTFKSSGDLSAKKKFVARREWHEEDELEDSEATIEDPTYSDPMFYLELSLDCSSL
jgi:hypothetical protein